MGLYTSLSVASWVAAAVRDIYFALTRRYWEELTHWGGNTAARVFNPMSVFPDSITFVQRRVTGVPPSPSERPSGREKIICNLHLAKPLPISFWNGPRQADVLGRDPRQTYLGKSESSPAIMYASKPY